MFNLVPFYRRNRGLVGVDDFFQDFFNNFPKTGLVNYTFNGFRTDIKEKDNEFIVQAELPGISKDDINIEINENYMTITAINNEIVEEEKNNYIRKERRNGRFQRSFDISDVNTDEIQAKYENGILEIKLPKTERTENIRRIDIQ